MIRKLLTMTAIVLIGLLALCGTSLAEDIPVPAFSIADSFEAGEPISVTFPEGLTDDFGAMVRIRNLETNEAEFTRTYFRNVLGPDNGVVLIRDGLDAGNYSADVWGVQANPYMRGTVSAYYFTVTGTRPEIPTVEIISNNAPWTGENEIRITCPGITGFIINAYDSEERTSWNMITSEDPYPYGPTWNQVSEDVISVRLNRKIRVQTEDWCTVAAVVNGRASHFTEDTVHLIWQEGEKLVLPSFTVQENLAAGEPLVLAFSEPFDEDMWISATVIQNDYYVTGCRFSCSALDDDYTMFLADNGLDSGEYRILVYAEQDGYVRSDTVICNLAVTGERPDVPTLEPIKNNAFSGQQNKLRITAESIDSFILYAQYYSEDLGMNFSGRVKDDEMEWEQVSDSEFLVNVNQPLGSMSAEYSVAGGVNGIFSIRSEQTVTLTWQEGAGPADEQTSVSVSEEELYTGNMVTVTASNPDAEKIRIYRKGQYEDPQIVQESDGTSCEYSIQYNMPAVVQFWAEACYNGEWSGVYSEMKTVRFISRGSLDAPTFECGTQFSPGETITVTRTNHVENEETCLLFISTPDHSRTIINGLSFNGEDILSVSAPAEAGEYILSVLVMAPGWTNNQTNLTIHVEGEDYSGEVGGGIWTLKNNVLTFSGPVNMGSWQLTSDIIGSQDIEKVVFGPEVSYIYPQFCSWIAHPAIMEVDPDNPSYCSADGVVYSKDGTVLIRYPAGKQDASFTVPAGVTTIGQDSFTFVSSLKTLILQEGVTEIEGYVFNYCDMEEIDLPASLQVIGNGDFRTTEALQTVNYAGTMTQWSSVTIGGQNTALLRQFIHCSDGDKAPDPETGWIGENLSYELDYITGNLVISGTGAMFSNPFTDNMSIVNVTINEGATNISYLAFAGCRNLTSISIPGTVTVIGYGAFSNCESLTDVTVPSSVAGISSRAFEGCRNLNSVTILNPNISIDNSNLSVFDRCSSSLVINGWPGSSAETCAQAADISFVPFELDFFLPSSLTTISEDAFNGIRAKSIVIPKTVTVISGNPFAGSDVQVIYGYAGSAAETFADEYSYGFIAVDDAWIANHKE